MVLTKLEAMEMIAKADGFGNSVRFDFTPVDWIEVIWHPEWGENADFEYKYNGVSYRNDREYIESKIPGEFMMDQ